MTTSVSPAKTYDTVRERFDDPQVALDYLRKKGHLNDSKNRREMACIIKGIEGLAQKSKVLDLPCGAGRLLPMLLDQGFEVVASDYSQEMINASQGFYQDQFKSVPDKSARLTFTQQDILKTTFEDNSFDAVICNRLLHHYPESALRRNVLAELLRITRPNGRLIVSYFSNFALSALRFHLKNKLKGITPAGRIPIWHRVFEQDFQAAGWKCTGQYPVRFGISPQTYLKLEPQ